ncbi:TPA: RNA pseudouridine synthase [Candidatus Dependentiae bacterium]|nr:MAG: Pseudouridine synthase [candidate division TM6 bacterium GW2011_GWE2_31_21]KKP53077.1 MAG: Pseudouridine synthase [candidate division TM6 bacterium GW2011_GWF2_33_332]HBS47896.1 RNA pseudouridine synthase [Candidatus Dependentiae bacterium]HBZ73500.1 RNA pseudouridine synthase [Candidatus Dependentiae bacterium]
MEKIIKIICDQDFAQKEQPRLDSYLANNLEDYSRSYLQGLIDDGNVSMNGKVAKKSSLVVKKGDEIIVSIPPAKQYDLTPQKVDFEIIDIQEDFIIINKPAGLIVHPANSCSEEVTLVHGLMYSFAEFAQFDPSERPGIVHRLDKDTSGLMIIARNQISQSKFAAMFKNREIHKNYLAVVSGHPDKSGKIDYPIGRHATIPTKMSHVGICSRDALTFFEVVEYLKETTVVSVKIVTGRTHQIRVHFAAIGHGLIGDKLYGINSKLIARQALHSWKLSFCYGGKEYFYEATIPSDIKSLIDSLDK